MAEQQKNGAPQPELSELLKIRRDKLYELQAAGQDPFQEVKATPQLS